MTITLRICTPPDALPDWYPPLDPEHPADYRLRYVELDMLIEAMILLGVVSEEPAEGEDLLAMDRFGEVGNEFDPDECVRISRSMRRFMQEEVPSEFFATLQERWNDTQAELRQAFEARGELVVSGFESFPYDARSLRSALLHWGAFTALAADHGGLEVVE
ncbi:hypothetical protein LXT21_29460 [Myxococcus sp. K38C18041901]|uniref:hypothetical protein n=1 Tax=Myxococcus guangdongensis TaxID=2906760 RepID=UPI0020A7E80F|nr:hypothetical protein [Myxococcus guangdongensis]MCP3062921.1 hypothetical protein [Myxococcus guangdongensis]